MKTLIVYFSYTKNNKFLACQLQKNLLCDIFEIEEERKRTGLTILLDLIFDRRPKLKDSGVSLSLYENVIFVAPIWAGKIASPLKSFLLKESGHIRSYSFISVCGGTKGQAEKINNELKNITGLDPIVVKELWINDLLPSDKKNSVKYTSGYRILPADLERFSEGIEALVKRAAGTPKHEAIWTTMNRKQSP